MSRNDKLFRAIVVMGAAITAPACGDDKCHNCQPAPDAKVAAVDAGVDGPTDAPVDVVLIL